MILDGTARSVKTPKQMPSARERDRMSEPEDKKPSKEIRSLIKSGETNQEKSKGVEPIEQASFSVPLNNPAEEEAARSLEDSAKRKTQIETHVSELGDSISKADEELDSKEKEIETDVGGANQAITSMKKSAVSSVTNIEAEVKKASGKLDEAFGKVRTVARIVPIAVAVAYYSLYVIQYGLAYNSSIYGGVGIAIVLSLIFKLIIDRASANLQTTKLQAIEQMKTTHEGLGGFLATRLRIEPNLKHAKDSFTRVAGYGQVILSAMRDYIPALEKAYATRDRLNRQLVFIKSLRNALVTYGFEIKGSTNDCLSGFGPLTESTDEWLHEASEKLSKTLDVSPQLLSLMYLDYVGEIEGKKNVWTTISSNDTLIRELSKIIISNGVVNTEYVDKDLENYGAIERLIAGGKPFNLDTFKIIYTRYYIDYAREKRTLIDSLRLYKIDLSETTETTLLKYVPSSFEEVERKTELFAEASKLTAVPIDIVKLSYYERTSESDARSSTWKDLKTKPNVLEALVSGIIKRNIIDVPTEFDKKSQYIQTFVTSSITPLHDFTLSTAQESTKKSFDEVEQLKETFLRTISGRIILDETQRRDFEQWLPVKTSPESVAQWLNESTRIPSLIFLLLYYDYIQDGRNRKSTFDEICSGVIVNDLARVLLEKNFIKLSKSEIEQIEDLIPNLALLLLKIGDYDRSNIQATFSMYNLLLNFTRGLVDFCLVHKVLESKLLPTFDQVLEAVGLEENEMLIQQELVLQSLINNYGPQEFKAPELLDHIVKATLAFYLVSHQHTLSPSACTMVGSDDGAARILYQYSRVNDDEEQRGLLVRTKFGMIIRRTIDGSFNDYEYLESFKKELVGGFMYFRISHMLEARLQSIHEAVKERSEIEQKFEQYDEAFTTLLETKFKTTNVVLESLQMNLVKAYVVTNPSPADVITGVIMQQMPKVCSDLAEGKLGKDPRYKNFLLTSERPFGKATRIGIVPFGMEFKEFSELFERAFQTAVEKNVREGAKHAPKDYAGNVIRIFPSSAYFKRVEGLPQASSTPDEDDPIIIITDLVRKHYKHIEKFELMASLHGDPDKTIAMKQLLTASIDESTTLYLMAEEQFAPIGGSKFYDDLRSGRVDQDLIASFGKTTRSELALAVFRAAGHDAKNAEMVKRKIAESIAAFAKNSRARLGDDDMVLVSNVAFQVLSDTGFLLSKLTP